MGMNDLCVLGEMIDGDAKRDAMHMAIAPVVADEKLAPGQHVGFVNSADFNRVGQSANPIGIVDPFLKTLVFPDQKFWLLLYQNTITSLRHDWSHPSFEPSDNVTHMTESELWLHAFAVRFNLSYEDVISPDSEFVTGGYINNGEEWRNEWHEVNDDFWRHHKAVTGIEVPESHRGGFSCSC